MVRREIVNGIEVVVEARAIGALGWTWAYHCASGQAATNSGHLLRTEEDAYSAAMWRPRVTSGRASAIDNLHFCAQARPIRWGKRPVCFTHRLGLRHDPRECIKRTWSHTSRPRACEARQKTRLRASWKPGSAWHKLLSAREKNWTRPWVSKPPTTSRIPGSYGCFGNAFE